MNRNFCDGVIYVIKNGDTLYSISRRYNTPLAVILRANPYIDMYNLQPGDEICIPIWPGGILDNPSSETPPSFRPVPPSNFPSLPEERLLVYIIKDQESLQDILNRFSIPLDDLLQYNDLSELSLAGGHSLRIPTTSASPSSPSAIPQSEVDRSGRNTTNTLDSAN